MCSAYPSKDQHSEITVTAQRRGRGVYLRRNCCCTSLNCSCDGDADRPRRTEPIVTDTAESSGHGSEGRSCQAALPLAWVTFRPSRPSFSCSTRATRWTDRITARASSSESDQMSSACRRAGRRACGRVTCPLSRNATLPSVFVHAPRRQQAVEGFCRTCNPPNNDIGVLALDATGAFDRCTRPPSSEATQRGSRRFVRRPKATRRDVTRMRGSR